MSVKALQDYTFVSKYARYNPKKKRRDTWPEAVERVADMHISRFPHVAEEIEWAFAQSKAKRVLGSQRALQYAGEPMLKKNARGYNCTTSYVDRIRFFQEALWLLLCGCGTGFSVQHHHIAKLPDFYPSFNRKHKTYTTPDSIEGWADALGILLATYLPHEEFSVDWNNHTYVDFDFSLIRPKGAPLSSGAGKAPGPEPLRTSLEAIRALLERCLVSGQKRLRSIDAYDIIMHASDAVLSGGVRRSASICLFSPDDELMIKAKTGNWFVENPQRGRSNNSAMLIRNETSREQFHWFMDSVKEFGEPGFVWADSTEITYNPCFHPDTRLATNRGSRNILDLFNEGRPVSVDYDLRPGKGDELVMDRRGVVNTEASAVKLTQKKAPVFTITTEHGHELTVTAPHKFPTLRGRISLSEMRVGDTILLPSEEQSFGNKGTFEDGLVLGLLTGDGVIVSNNREAFVDIWSDDFDHREAILTAVRSLTSQVSKDPKTRRNAYPEGNWMKSGESKLRTGGRKLYRYVSENLGVDPNLMKTRIPEFIWQGSRDLIRGYLQGFLFADGSINTDFREGRPPTFNWRLHQANKPILQDVQALLGMFGVVSRIYLRREEQMCPLPDGKGGTAQFLCKDNYDLIVNRPNSIRMFERVGAFGRKSTIIANAIVKCGTKCYKPERFLTKINKIEPAGLSDVYCLEQPVTNTVIANGLVTGQCVEIGLYPVDPLTGETGFAFCNLCEINGKKCKTEEDFRIAARAAAIIGTLQAAYTDFDYLGPASKRIADREALLGVSITGMMDSPDVLFDPAIQRRTAELIVEVNKEFAAKIGINQAARVTCVKPSGTTSLVLGTSSGIHAHHSQRYIRRIQANVLEAPANFYSQKNPLSSELSVWSKNGTDCCIAFCVETSPGARTRKEVDALTLLEHVKLTQNNWVAAGKVKELCAQPYLNHNVSNTITVRENEWDLVEEFIYENRDSFAGISLLSAQGDLDYPQAPFTAIQTPEDLVKIYGKGIMFASGLIVDGQHAFDGNLWDACYTLIGGGQALLVDDESVPLVDRMWAASQVFVEEFTGDPAKQDWMRRALQFAGRYFWYDVKKMTYALKETSNFKLWCDLRRETVDVDFSELIEDTDDTKIQETIACAGNSCEI